MTATMMMFTAFLALAGVGHAAGVTTATAVSIQEMEAGELMRAWMAGQGVAGTKAAGGDPLADWRAYLKALELPEAAGREKALRTVYGRTRSAMLRMVVLRAITENPQYQGRQALFIRKYGFYANWFNRVVYSASRLVQGNLQVLAQLTVEGFHDLFVSGEADPTTRRAYDMLRRAQAEAGRPAADPKKLAKLEKAVLRALAETDLDQAQWALAAGDPEGAAFYATQAHTLQPEWKKAEEVRLKAESEAARQRREGVASSQVGYPDRNPPVEATDPKLVRGLLAGTPARDEGLSAGERLVLAAARDLETSRAGQATLMRSWQELLEKDPEPGSAAHRWLEAVTYDPQANVDERLARARSQQRSSTLRFIFAGPERPRERIYKTASWFTTAWDALSNVGVFYVFEVIGRTGQAAFAPPVPAEEILDAQAAWLSRAPDPKSREARRLADALGRAYLKQNRYDDARRVLERAGLLDGGRAGKINKAQAVWLLERARRMPEGPDRSAVLMRIEALAPGSGTARKAAQIPKDEKKRAELRRLVLDWEAMARWTGAKAPCGLPGEAAWFDGAAAGGEAAREGLTLERRDGAAEMTVRYPVNYFDGQRIFQVNVPFERLPAVVRAWFELAAGQGAEAAQTIKALHRLPIPFSLEGGAGPSGVDFYPKLLPIQTRPGEIELYR